MPAYPALLDPSVDTYKIMRESVNSMITRLESIESSGVAAHTQDFSTITARPTTLAGYGIVDAAAASHVHDWTDITTGVPTTLAGFGITDGIVVGNIQASTDFDTIDGGNIPASVIPFGAAANTVAEGDHLHPGVYNPTIGIDTNVGPLSTNVVISEIQMTDGVITATNTRTISAGDVGAATTGHTHPGLYNPTIGTDTDLTTTSAQVIDTISLTDGVVVSAITTRNLAALNVVAESVDTTCYLWFSNGSSGVNTVKSNVSLQFNAATAELSSTSFNATSDIRLKENINDYIATSASDIATYSFDYIDGKKSQVGYIAQEVIEVLPNAVTTRDDGVMTVNYSMVLAAKMAELEAEVKSLKAQLNG